MTNFNDLMEGMKPRDENLSDDHHEAIRGFIQSDSISPNFVKRFVAEYSDDSIRLTFFVKSRIRADWLDYIFRCHKGHFCCKRYPSFSVV